MMGHYTIRACYTTPYRGAIIKAFQTDPDCGRMPWGDLSWFPSPLPVVPDQNTFIHG